MDNIYKELKITQTTPGLWVREVSLYDQEVDLPIRTIPLRRGVNVIWAHEPSSPEADGQTPLSGIDMAGHGVGKTSFCLLLRYCLCDISKAIDVLREELTVEFPKGGVAAIVSVAGEDWTVFRPYAKHRRSIAKRGNHLNEVFGNSEDRVDFSQYERYLSDSLLDSVSPKTIPSTGQDIEWRHLLSWLTRDQSARFMGFYHWREGEGAGLQRPKLDPPILLRSVLGLMAESETGVLVKLRAAEQELAQADKNLEELKRKPAYILSRIERNLRQWGSYSDSLPLSSDDLWENSIIGSINAECEKLKSLNEKSVSQLAEIDKEQVEASASSVQEKRHVDICQIEMDKISAVVANNITALDAATNKKKTLLDLAGYCPVCNLLYRGQCEHVKEEFPKSDIKLRRDQNDFSQVASEYAGKAPAAKASLENAQRLSSQANDSLAILKRKYNTIKTENIERSYKINRAKELVDEYTRWSKELNSPQTSAELKAAESEMTKKINRVNSLELQVRNIKDNKTEREKILSALVSQMARELLGEYAFGYLDSHNPDTPFILSMQGGEAYRVLSVLLGDYASLIFSTLEPSAFPGFLMHDCPREADMSEVLYHHALDVLRKFEQESCTESAEPAFQYILTTTTPPPGLLQDKPYLVLELRPDKTDTMLFKRRFGRVDNSVGMALTT